MLAGNVPSPPRERGRWALALVLLLVGAATLVAILSGRVGRVSPPPLPAAARTPSPARRVFDPLTGTRRYVTDVQPAQPAKVIAPPPRRQPRSRSASAVAPLQQPVARTWMEGFYPVYEAAQRSFRVNWLLIASIHRQETAFSTASSTYQGLNFAGCCGGPMQFNVSNGPVTTWDLVKDSYRDGVRPSYYEHRTAHHPSIYDDFDSIMAAAHLLQLDGASEALGQSAWWAAYDYYGHDSFGVRYADEVLARAIGWSQHGFCASCGTSARLIDAVDAAYGAPVRAALEAEAEEAAAKAEAEAEAEAGKLRRKRSRSARPRRGRSQRRSRRAAAG